MQRTLPSCATDMKTRPMWRAGRATRWFSWPIKITKCFRLLVWSNVVRILSPVCSTVSKPGRQDAVPRHSPPGRKWRVTVAWDTELLRVIELDPHQVGQETANWTTELLAVYLGRHTGIQATEETVRVYLHAHGYVCKRPTWTLRRKAGEQAVTLGKECG